MVDRFSNIIKFSQKNKRLLTIIAICANNHILYNYIQHIGDYFVQKYRRYQINFNCYEPYKLSKKDLEGLHSYPSFIFYKNDQKKLYHGVNTNNIENIIFSMVN
jgi:hypothetical protein